MVSLETPVCEFNKDIIDFSLPGVDGKVWTPELARGENGLLVMFICNHCPYVQSIRERIVRDTKELVQKGINSIAIASNRSRRTSPCAVSLRLASNLPRYCNLRSLL